MPKSAESPKLSLSINGTDYDIGSVDYYHISPQGRITLRLVTINNEIVVIKGRLKSGDIKPDEATQALGRVETLQKEADEAVAETPIESEEYHEVTKQAATIHLGAIEIAGGVPDLMKPENDPKFNEDVAARSVRILKRGDTYRSSSHFRHLKESGLEGSRLAARLDESLSAAAVKLANKMKELGMEVDPFLARFTGDSAKAEKEGPGGAPSGAGTAISGLYANSKADLELVLELLKERKEHMDAVRKAVTETKEEIKEEERLLDKRLFEKRCADMLALLKQISETADPEKAKQLLKSLTTMLKSAVKQLSENRAEFAPKTVNEIETILGKIKERVNKLQTESVN
ncbi:MAG TPA: hypothetical protein VMD02_01790 [Candidatus Omnitrophota bacterium]|nr:hypothetical protein [Candidatus Omnitrophota bacterium]